MKLKPIHKKLLILAVIIAVIVILVVLFCRSRKEGLSLTPSDGHGVEDIGSLLKKYPMNTYFSASSFPVARIATDIVLPDSFDGWRKANLLHTSRDQGQCGSCWAFSVTGVLADRIKIQTCGKFTDYLSVQYLICCNHKENGCNGASSLDEVFQSMTHDGSVGGIPLEETFPYTGSVADCSTIVPSCKNLPAGTHKLDFIDNSIRTLSESNADGSMTPDQLAKNIIRMKQDIIQNGPISVAMTVFSDFFNYKNGVYVPNSTTVVGQHAIKAVGWGKTTDDSMGVPKGTDYWIIRNSWSKTWGLQGYFLIKTGTPCNIEGNAYSGQPDMTHPYLVGLAKGCTPPNFIKPTPPQPQPSPQPTPSGMKKINIKNPTSVEVDVVGGTITEGFRRY